MSETGNQNVVFNQSDERDDTQFTGTLNVTTDNTNDDTKNSKYTYVDHLDEDTPLEGQDYALFTFLSPEGVMNCNVRAFKFIGAYKTLEQAQKGADEYVKKNKYFKVFIGQTGKWLEFDPPDNKVEREMSSNKEHQKLLDAQRKHRMDKMNALAGKYKEMIDKKDAGKTERIQESKKSSAALDAVEKQKPKKEEEKPQIQKSRELAKERTKERLRKRLAESKNRKIAESIDNQDLKVVKRSENTENRDQFTNAEKNIERIKQLLDKRRNEKN